MAKKGKKAPKTAPKKQGLESVGWGFWLICFAVLLGPCWYIGYDYSYNNMKAGLFPWVVGFSMAAFGAGILSLVVNYLLQKRIELRVKKLKKNK